MEVVGEMTSSVRIYRDPRDLTADEFSMIILSSLRREYPRRIKRIITYVGRHSDSLGIAIDNPHSLSMRIVQRLKALEEERKVEWTPHGWKLR